MLPDGPLTEIVRQAEAGYPEEICGMVVGQHGAPETYRVRQVTNIANREPQEDPSGVARDARTAYKMDPLEQLRILREADEHGWEVAVFYHSHPDHGRTSPAWIVSAPGAMVPMWPGATYLVVSVMRGVCGAQRGYRWDAPAGIFRYRCSSLNPEHASQAAPPCGLPMGGQRGGRDWSQFGRIRRRGSVKTADALSLLIALK
jgi:proteasome lid subunit RPN8/RPN11